MHRLTDRLRWAGKRIHDSLVRARSVSLGVGGLGSINLAVWINTVTWGLVVTGLSLLLLQSLTDGER